MISLLIVGLPILAVVIWLYLKFSPEDCQRRRNFESVVLSVLFVGGGVITFLNYESLKDTNDAAWWPVASIVSNFIFVIVTLSVSFIVRRLLAKRTEQGADRKPDNVLS